MQHFLVVVDGMEIVQDKHDVTVELLEIGREQVRDADGVGAVSQTALQLRRRWYALQRTFKSFLDAPKQHPRIGVKPLQREPGHRGSAFARIAGRQRALAKSSRRPHQDKGPRAICVQHIQQPWRGATRAARRPAGAIAAGEPP